MCPHDNRSLMNPLPVNDFDQIYDAISKMPNKTVVGLLTTGGVEFKAQAKTSPRVGKFIQLPHNNRIYPCCWGNTTNHIGKNSGQGIGQYARALDEWFKKSH